MMGAREETERLAWVVLRAANRTQAKGSTARLVVPRAPEVADEMGMDLTDVQFVSVEEYLEERGYVAFADLGLIWDAFTITPAGLKWLEASLYDREDAAFEAALRAEVEEARGKLALEAVERGRLEQGGLERGRGRAPRWWRRAFGG
jgi:hypothetical protein